MVQNVHGNIELNTRYGEWARHAKNVIKDTYGDDTIIKPKNLLKFGRTNNADTDALTTVAIFPGATQRFETLLMDNLIDRVSSATDTDTQLLGLEGHTIDGSGNLTFVVQEVTLTGQTPATIGTPLARLTRIFNKGSTDLDGAVYGFESGGTVTNGVPQVDMDVHAVISAGKNQTEKAQTAFSYQDYGLITSLYASIARGNSAVNVDIEFEVKESGGVFRQQVGFTLRSDGNSFDVIQFRPFLIVPTNADVRVVATASVNDTTVNAGFNALLGFVQ